MKSKKSQDTRGKNISVAVRMRPLLYKFQDEPAWCADKKNNCVTSISRGTAMKAISQNQNDSYVVKRKSSDMFCNYSFNFDYVFDHQSTTHQIFQQGCSKLIDGFLEGSNCTIFMYGQTTSGKTYTMLGDQNFEGIITYSLLDIFKKFNDLNKHKKLEIWISYLQIYNQQINDLLNPGSVNLKIQEDLTNGIFVQGLKQCKAQTLEEAEDLLIKGQEQRRYKQKNIHDHSSRSHTIFQIKIHSVGDSKTKCYLNLVDLAGSERLHDEQKGNIENQEQTGYINKSLFVLSNVINKLAKGRKNTHIPFRDSKLTRLLSSSLNGNSLTMIICTLSPAAMNFYQTLSTLRFATNAKKIETKPITAESFEDVNDKQNIKDFVVRQEKQIDSLKDQNLRLKRRWEQAYQKQVQLSDKIQEVLADRSFAANKQVSSCSYGDKYEEQQYLVRLKLLIEDQLSLQSTQQWEQKSSNLCEQYAKNIEILHQKYKIALFNIAQNEFPHHAQQLGFLSKGRVSQQIFDRIKSRQIFNDIVISSILNSDCDQQIDIEQLNCAYNEARKSLLQRYIQLKKLLLKKKQNGVLCTLEKLFSQKMSIIQKAYKEVYKSRKF